MKSFFLIAAAMISSTAFAETTRTIEFSSEGMIFNAEVTTPESAASNNEEYFERSGFAEAVANRHSAEEVLAVLEADPANANCDITVKVGNAVVTNIKDRRETIGQKEILKPSQWATDVGAVVKGATGGIEGSATIKVAVDRTDPQGGRTKVKVEITITARK